MAVYHKAFIKLIANKIVYATTLILWICKVSTKLNERMNLLPDFKNIMQCHHLSQWKSKHDDKKTHEVFKSPYNACAFYVTLLKGTVSRNNLLARTCSFFARQSSKHDVKMTQAQSLYYPKFIVLFTLQFKMALYHVTSYLPAHGLV